MIQINGKSVTVLLFCKKNAYSLQNKTLEKAFNLQTN